LSIVTMSRVGTAWGTSLLLALTLIRGARAHRLDEYLQATLIGATPRGTDIEISLTPGVAMLPALMAVIDQDRDGRISAQEERAYVARVARDLELRVDGLRAPMYLVESQFPAIETMREGLGTIRVKLRTSRAGHALRFENRHLPQVSVYLVNCLAAPSDGLVVGRQQRDEAQRSIELEYSFGAGTPLAPRTAWIEQGSLWPAAIAMLLVARMAILIYTTKRHKRAAHLPEAPAG
jgi:hypothetical protein